jgi:hypothetical protein
MIDLAKTQHTHTKQKRKGKQMIIELDKKINLFKNVK